MFTIFQNRVFLIVNISMLFAIVVVQGIFFRSQYHVVDSLLGLLLFDCILIFMMKRQAKR